MTNLYEKIEKLNKASTPFPYDGKIVDVLTDTTVRVRQIGSKTTIKATLSDQLQQSVADETLTLVRGMPVKLQMYQTSMYVTDVLSQFDKDETYVGKGTRILEAPKLQVILTENGYSISWGEVAGADRYIIYKNNAADYQTSIKVGETKNTSIFVPFDGSYTYFAVRGVSGLNSGSLSPWLTASNSELVVRLNAAVAIAGETGITIDVKDLLDGQHLQPVFVDDVLRITYVNGVNIDDNWFVVKSVTDMTTYFRLSVDRQSGTSATLPVDSTVTVYKSGGNVYAGGNANDPTDIPYIDILTGNGSAVTPQIRMGALDDLAISANATGAGIAIAPSLTESAVSDPPSAIINETGVYLENIDLTIKGGGLNILNGDGQPALTFDEQTGELMIFDWGHPNDRTLINGGQIYTNTITADQIAANTITANEIDVNSIQAAVVTADYINALSIEAGSIQAGVSSGAHVVMNASGITGYGTDGATVEWSATTADGKLKAGGGNVVLSSAGLTATGSTTITGGTIQTASSGKRVVMSGSQIVGYNSSNGVEWLIDGDNMKSGGNESVKINQDGISIKVDPTTNAGYYPATHSFRFNDEYGAAMGGLYFQEYTPNGYVNAQLIVQGTSRSPDSWLKIASGDMEIVANGRGTVKVGGSGRYYFNGDNYLFMAGGSLYWSHNGTDTKIA